MSDLIGQRFGKLTVIERAEDYISPKGRHWKKWKCRCDCGNTIVARENHLKEGDTKTCRRCKNGNRLYGVWAGMKYRCENPNAPKYPIYGGRGIKVCDEWQDYAKFREWACENGYNPDAPYGKCTIDRIDVDKGYEPTNCRWVDMKIQNNNRRI